MAEPWQFPISGYNYDDPREQYTWVGADGQTHHSHPGIDWGTPDGTPLGAPEDGIIHYILNWGGGWAVTETNDDGTSWLFGHIRSRDVPEGSRVKAGTVIAHSGGAPGDPGQGHSSGPHTHVEFHLRDGRRENPAKALVERSSRIHDPVGDVVGGIVGGVGNVVGGIGSAAEAAGKAISIIVSIGGWLFSHLWDMALTVLGAALILMGFALVKRIDVSEAMSSAAPMVAEAA